MRYHFIDNRPNDQSQCIAAFKSLDDIQLFELLKLEMEGMHDSRLIDLTQQRKEGLFLSFTQASYQQPQRTFYVTTQWQKAGATTTIASFVALNDAYLFAQACYSQVNSQVSHMKVSYLLIRIVERKEKDDIEHAQALIDSSTGSHPFKEGPQLRLRKHDHLSGMSPNQLNASDDEHDDDDQA